MADFSLYMVLNIPSFIIVLIGFRSKETNLNQGYIVTIDLVTRISFGIVLLSLIYLIGFFQRNNADYIYKSLGLLLFIIGHIPNMVILSILNFWSNDGVSCNSGSQPYLLYFGMINPFTFNFFNPVLQYYICTTDPYNRQMLTVQWVFTLLHLLLGLLMFSAVIKLEQRSFL